MAEGDASVYNHFKEILLLGEVALEDDTLKVILVDSDYSVAIDGSLGLADIDSMEITGSGYAAGGCTLAGGAVTQRDTVDNAQFDGTDLTWANLGTDGISGAILYDDTITATYASAVADPLLVYWEITTNSNGGNYTLQFGASGILVLS